MTAYLDDYIVLGVPLIWIVGFGFIGAGYLWYLTHKYHYPFCCVKTMPIFSNRISNNAPTIIYDVDGMRGDWWAAQARKMLGKPLAKIELRGCMAHIENIEAEGYCCAVERNADPYGTRVIWEALGETDAGKKFKVIVAQCLWNDDRSRWEEHY